MSPFTMKKKTNNKNTTIYKQITCSMPSMTIVYTFYLKIENDSFLATEENYNSTMYKHTWTQ